MVSKKKKLQRLARFTLVMFLIGIMVSFTGTMTTNAEISQQKQDLISTLYTVLKGTDDETRLDVLRAITGRANIEIGPYSMKNIDTEIKAYNLADEIKIIVYPAEIDRTTLMTVLQDFYNYQQTNSSIAKFVLQQFKNGLDIGDDKYTNGDFDTIKERIEEYTYEYLLFVNFVKEVKDIYNVFTTQSFNPLYMGSDKKIQIYDDLERMADTIGNLITDDRASDYKGRLLGLLVTLNDKSPESERENFAKNLNAHNLLDLTQKSHTITDPDDNDGPSGGGGSGGGGGAPSIDTTTPTPQANTDGSASVKVDAALNSTTGNAAVVVNESTINQLLSLSKPQADGTKDITIEVPKVEGAKSYSVSIPGNALTKPTVSEELTIKTDAGNITLPSNIFAEDASVKNKNVSLNIAKADKSTLSPELQQKVGDKPVISLSFTVNGVVKEYNNPNIPVTVSFNYKPTGTEALESEFLVVWYIDNAGNLIEVPSGKYDAVSGTVTFTTTHFSKYLLAFNHKTFTDVNNTHWAKKVIEVLASKGIARGTSDNNFAPDDSITRGDYLAMLVRALGVNAAVNENFSDIKITDANFKEIAIAKKLGITVGVGNNMFKPDEFITRQDLMVLTDRALTVVKKIKEKGAPSDLDKFTDKAKIAAYARDSAATMVKEGIIIGSGSLIGPADKTTRAQAATIVYRIYNK